MGRVGETGKEGNCIGKGGGPGRAIIPFEPIHQKWSCGGNFLVKVIHVHMTLIKVTMLRL
jgi:hypothetical protein